MNINLKQRSPQSKDEHYTWHPMGTGGLESHESLEEAVRREIKEECGAEVIEMEFMGFRESVRENDGEQIHWIHFDYKVLINPKEVSIKEPDKCIDMKWMTVDNIPEPQHSTFPAFLEKYKEFLK